MGKNILAVCIGFNSGFNDRTVLTAGKINQMFDDFTEYLRQMRGIGWTILYPQQTVQILKFLDKMRNLCETK